MHIGRSAAVAAALLVVCGRLQLVLAGNDLDDRSTTLLTKDTFDEYLSQQLEKNRPSLIMFHVSWCKVCQITFPRFAGASDQLVEQDIPMDFAHVDCTDDKTLCKRFTVKGYPTIKLFSPEAGAEPAPYKSQRSQEGFVKYAQRMTMPPLRAFPSAAEFDEAARNETFSAFVAVANPEDPPAGLLETAKLWRDRHIFAVAPRLEDLLPKSISVPAGAKLAVLSVGAQQWPGADNTSTASPFASFFDGDLADATVVSDWVNRSRFSGIWYLGETNFYEFTHASRRTAMIAVDPLGVTTSQEQLVRSTAALLSDDFLFGVLDGDNWAEELKDFNIARDELPRVLVSEQDFEVWMEDVDELRLETLEEDLRGLISGKKQLLRQGRGAFAKLMFFKRKIWRYMVLLHDYSRRGPIEAMLAVTTVIAGTFFVMAIGWFAMSCCNILLREDPDIDYPPRPKAQARHPKKD